MFYTHIFRYKKSKDFSNDEIDVLITLYYEFFIDESTFNRAKEPTVITSYDYPANPYHEEIERRTEIDIFEEPHQRLHLDDDDEEEESKNASPLEDHSEDVKGKFR